MLKDSSLRAEVVAAATKSKAAVADLAGGITVNGGTLAVSAGREMQSTSALPRLGADNTYTGAAALGGGAPLSAPIPASSPASATAAPPVVMSPVPASPAQPAAPPVADVERAAVGGRAPAGVQTWNFVQTEDRTRLRRNFNSPPPVNILNSFQFEHSGDVVRVVDEDGSIYTGSIGTDKSAINGRVGGGVTELTKKAGAAPGAQQVYFHVTGTNRSLKQPVVFDGSLTWPAAAVLPNQDAFKTATGTAATNAQLQGRVRVGTRMQMDINAVPSTR